MKTIKKISFALLFALCFAFTATAVELDKPTTTLRDQVIELIKAPNMEYGAMEEVKVQFLVNKKNELVVVAVDTDDSYLAAFVKSRMNYKKIDGENAKHNEIYKINVTFKGT